MQGDTAALGAFPWARAPCVAVAACRRGPSGRAAPSLAPEGRPRLTRPPPGGAVGPAQAGSEGRARRGEPGMTPQQGTGNRE